MITIPKLYVFIGLPGAGKSTYYHKQLAQCKRFCPSKIARSRPSLEVVPQRTARVMANLIKTALEAGEDVVIDDTNLDKGTRRLILAQRPAECPAVAVFFSAGVKHCLERMQEVSPSTLLQMAGTMEFPEYEEGFDAIYVTGAEPNRLVK